MKKMMIVGKKGVSPMIATILLIAMVLIIAAVIFLWLKNMVKEDVTKFNDENIELVCQDIIMEASYENNGIVVVNNGNVPIYGLKVDIYTESGNEEISLDGTTDPALKKGINQGGSYTKTFSSEQLVGATKLIIYPILIGNSDDGTRTYTCLDYGKERSL